MCLLFVLDFFFCHTLSKTTAVFGAEPDTSYRKCSQADTALGTPTCLFATQGVTNSLPFGVRKEMTEIFCESSWMLWSSVSKGVLSPPWLVGLSAACWVSGTLSFLVSLLQLGLRRHLLLGHPAVCLGERIGGIEQSTIGEWCPSGWGTSPTWWCWLEPNPHAHHRRAWWPHHGHPQQTPTETFLGSLKNAFLANSFAMNELTFSTWEGVTRGFVRAALAHAAICVLGWVVPRFDPEKLIFPLSAVHCMLG